MRLIYEERKLFNIFIMSMLSTLIFLILFNYLNIEKLPSLIYYSIILLIALLIINFHALRIEVTDKELIFGFGLIKNRIRLEDIRECTRIKIGFRNYLGFGIRYGMDNTLAYNTRFGDAIRIKTKTKKRDYVITTDNPERLCKLLK